MEQNCQECDFRKWGTQKRKHKAEKENEQKIRV